MGAVAQCHEGQQGPVVLDGRVVALVDAEPALHLGAACMVEVDDRHERDEALPGALLRRRRRRDGHGCLGGGGSSEDLVCFVGMPTSRGVIEGGVWRWQSLWKCGHQDAVEQLAVVKSVLGDFPSRGRVEVALPAPSRRGPGFPRITEGDGAAAGLSPLSLSLYCGGQEPVMKQ
jgi:hypothetical protein